MAAGCGKQVYDSPATARFCHRKAGFNVRVYWCDQCRGHHATNDDKSKRRRRWHTAAKKHRNRKDRRTWTPDA